MEHSEINTNETLYTSEAPDTEASEAKVKTRAAKNKKADNDYWEERIEQVFPIDFSQPKIKQKTIIVNGYPFTIRLGEKVSVPRYVVQTYMDSENQRIKTLGLQDKYSKNVNLTDE